MKLHIAELDAEPEPGFDILTDEHRIKFCIDCPVPGNSETAELVSQMLGQQMVATESFGLGSELRDLTQFSMGVSPRNLMTPDELRRLPEDEEIIFIRNLKPD